LEVSIDTFPTGLKGETSPKKYSKRSAKGENIQEYEKKILKIAVQLLEIAINPAYGKIVVEILRDFWRTNQSKGEYACVSYTSILTLVNRRGHLTKWEGNGYGVVNQRVEH